MRVVHCSFCGANNASQLFSSSDRLLGKKSQHYILHQCRKCGLIYINPRPDTPSELAQIYPPEYSSYVKSNQRFLRYVRQMAWKPEIHEILQYSHAESRILEIGCATGEFLALLHKHRPYTEGIELNTDVAKIARTRHNLPVCAGELADAAFEPQSFDIIFMRHVFEHMADPLQELRIIRNLLKPGGVFIVTLPNADSYEAKLFGADWYGWDVPRHFHLFPRATLLHMLQTSGLDFEKITYLPLPNTLIGSIRYRLDSSGLAKIASLIRYENPLALALFAPCAIAAAHLQTSGYIRIHARRPGMQA